MSAFRRQVLGERPILAGPCLRLANSVLQFEVLFVEELVKPLQGLRVHPWAHNSCRDMGMRLTHRRTARPLCGLANASACAVETPNMANTSHSYAMASAHPPDGSWRLLRM